MKRLTFAIATATLLAFGPARADEQAELVAKGRAIAQEKCGRCHAVGASDKSPLESAPPFRFVAERYPSEHLAEALAEGIVTRHPEMPVFVFDPPAIEAFLAYLDNFPVQATKPKNPK